MNADYLRAAVPEQWRDAAVTAVVNALVSKLPDSWRMHAVRTGSGNLEHPGHLYYARCYANHPEDVVVEVEVRLDPQGLHVGWLAVDSTEPRMVYLKPFLLDMCFPAGVRHAMQTGRGLGVHLTLTQVHEKT